MAKFYTFIVQAVVNFGVVVVLLLAVKILPNSPFDSFLNHNSVGHIWNYMKYINYFVPIPQIIAILEAWLCCIMEWYLWRFIYDISKNLSAGGTDIMSLGG